MKPALHPNTLRRTLRWTQAVLFSAAALLLLYCGFVVVSTSIFQMSEGRRLERLLTERRSSPNPAPITAPSTPPEPLPPAIDGTLIGRIQVTRLALSAIVIEGTSRSVLRRAVGHIAATSLPGRPGNIGLAGHRDTFFRPLRDIRWNDLIILTTVNGEFRYRVVSTTIVDPNDVGVLDSDQREILTLVTCYPFKFIGSAPSRFIVRARRV